MIPYHQGHMSANGAQMAAVEIYGIDKMEVDL